MESTFRSGLKIISAAVFCGTVLSLPFPAFAGGSEILVKKKVEELKNLNEELHKAIGSLKKYNNKNIYLKVRFLPSKDGKTAFKIEKISATKIKDKNEDKTLILKCKVVKDSREQDKYKLDLSYVLPPEDDKEKHKAKSKDDNKMKTQKRDNKK